MTRPVSRAAPRNAPRAALLAALLLLAGCGGGAYRTGWDGRRGYDGNGDYGYDLNAPRQAVRFEERARRSYPAPGPAGDPWGPYIREAASRFSLPEAWIRGVMRQESGGRQFDAWGAPVVSVAGAMGLMQVMPRTYEMLRARYGARDNLGPDPFEPRSNIMAGTAYLKEMYDRFGAPGFLAAYNAGPDRVDAYLAGATVLPDETVNYVAAIGPRIGMAGTFGPGNEAYGGVAYGGRAVPAGYVPSYAADDPANAAYAGGGLTGSDYAAMRR